MRPKVMMRDGDKSHYCWVGHGVVGLDLRIPIKLSQDC